MSLASPIRFPARLEAIDLLRGLVIALMALDHTRDFFHTHAFGQWSALDVEHTTVATYATRWITHLCAPTFVFLAGVSAYLRGGRGGSRAELSRFLVTRGLWLVFLELTVIHWFGWWFAVKPTMFGLKVIWALGVSMICLAGIIWLPRWVIAVFGSVVVVGHQFLHKIAPADVGALAPLWRILHEPGAIKEWSLIKVHVAYPLVPWIGVMALGYTFGPIAGGDPVARRRWLLRAGLSALASFAVLRGFNLFGDSKPWTSQGDWLSTLGVILDVRKYPPSLSYLLITLGISSLLWFWFEHGTPRPLRFLLAFGATPLFVYVIHLPLIHGLSALTHEVVRGDGGWLLGQRYFDGPYPEQLGFSLAVTYVAWCTMLALLYLPARWVAALKRRRRDWWLGYL